MSLFERISIALLLLTLWLAAGAISVFAQAQLSAEEILAAGQEAILECRYPKAIRVLRNGLKKFPGDNRLWLELGRAYLFKSEDNHAIRLFRQVLAIEPENRLAKLELARALGYHQNYATSNRLYQELLAANAADEPAAIGLASNLLHQKRASEARDVVQKALAFHRNSLRLQEYADRIDKGELGGEERQTVDRPNVIGLEGDYVNDSAANHTWRSSQRFEFEMVPSVSNRLLVEQRVQHSLDDPGLVAQSFTDEVHLKPSEWLLLVAGAGATRYPDGDSKALYRAAAAFHPVKHLWLETGFSRTPVYPTAEAAEHELTAEGWEALANWTPGAWRLGAYWSRQHYSDGNLASRQNAELVRQFGGSRLTFETGYRYTRYSFKQEFEHGYFSPDEYQSHLGVAGVLLRAGTRFRGEYFVRAGAESIFQGSPYRSAWEVHLTNQILLGNWEVEFGYTRFHLAQSTGAFRADAGHFAVAYHF